jgi:hypothetical protein
MDRVNGIPIIDDATPDRDIFRTDVAYGYVPRDYSVDPEEMFAPPSDMKLHPESDWDGLWEEQQEQKSSLEHIWRVADNGRQPKNLYQNGDPLCWAHSTTNAVQVARAVANEPYEPLSAYMVAAFTNNYRKTGGWCGQSAKGIAEHGVCSQKLWPQQQYSKNLDTPEMRADAKKRRIQEEWRDLTRPIHGQTLTWQQAVSCGFNRQPMACDFMWWSHSVCGMGAYRIEPGSWGFLILNSHGDNDGDRGFHILRGSKARPDGAIAIRSVTAAG